MKLISQRKKVSSGATLIEAMIAMAVLAVAVPLVLGTIAEGGKSGMAAEAETRSTWMVSTCMEEINASREARSRYFPATTTGQSFPAAGEVWALAFSPDGKPVGKLSKSQHDQGIKQLGGKPVRFIAVISATAPLSSSGSVTMLDTRVSIQYPAAAPAAKRGKLEYNTLIP